MSVMAAPPPTNANTQSQDPTPASPFTLAQLRKALSPNQLTALSTVLQATQPIARASPNPSPVPELDDRPTTTTTKTAFPKHARLTGSKSFPNWVRQLCASLPTEIHSYILDGLPPATWTASQLASRKTLAATIDSPNVLAALDSIPIATLTAPTIFPTLKACYAPDDATRTLELFTKLWGFRPMPGTVEEFDKWLTKRNAIVRKITDAETSLNDVMVTHLLATAHPLLDNFKSSFTNKQQSQCQLPQMDLISDHICVQLCTSNLPKEQSAMLASSSARMTKTTCPTCKGSHCIANCTTQDQHPPRGPCHRCHCKGHWNLDCNFRSSEA